MRTHPMSYDPESYYPGEFDRPALKHSGFGIASFIIGLVIGFLDLAIVGVAGVLAATKPGGLDEDSPVAMLLGLCIFALVFINLIGLGLGIAGLCQARRNKTFAFLGIAIGALTLVGMAALTIIGILSD